MKITDPNNSKKVPVAERLWRCCRQGAVKSLRQIAWLLLIMIPVSLLVTILAWSGALEHISRPLGPLFEHLGMKPEMCVAFVTGLCLNIYSGIAALSSIEGITERAITIFALTSLISHAFFLELPVQRKMGVPVICMGLLRLTASACCALGLNLLLPHESTPAMASIAGATKLPADFWPMLGVWALGAMKLCAKIIILVSLLMILQRFLDEFGLVKILAGLLRPIMWLLGLPSRVAFLWIAANTLGLAYGAGVFVEQLESKRLRKPDAVLLNCSVGICHSLLEDTILFVAIGAWAIWITVPRLLLAAAAVWTVRLWRQLRPTAAPESD